MDALRREEKLHSPALIEACEDNAPLCTLIFIFPASRRWPGADRGRMDTRGENGELSSEEDKVQHLLVDASYPGTLIALPALKSGLFAVKLNFKSTQCGLGCLHSGVSRTLELSLKGIVLMFCVFLSDCSNTRGFGIILDLEQSLSALFILFLFVKLTHGQFLFPLPEIPNNSPDLYMIIPGSCCCK